MKWVVLEKRFYQNEIQAIEQESNTLQVPQATQNIVRTKSVFFVFQTH